QSIILNENSSDGPSGPANGVAPEADLVVVKAFGADGSGSYADVIRGLDWIVANAATYGIRVLNLSFSAEPRSHYWEDPMAQAVMAAWQSGIFVVASAGNSGPGAGTVDSPGNGKNMITVGASENDRPADEDGPWVDGCAVGPSGADDAMDVIDFSSRGPAPGSRVKPETIAPGTHVQGTASTHPAYNGFGVCDQYRPSGQTVFA
ncbi:MAG: S8 family serine peptidase, partial [bacterium]|nr:S8 family serine peptidase [bacterium]